ncbi:hypothetical protein ACP70R_023704 [Stipagrostis hirtigluma subsp. patula]
MDGSSKLLRWMATLEESRYATLVACLADPEQVDEMRAGKEGSMRLCDRCTALIHGPVA